MGLLGNTNKKTYILILFMFLILLLVGSLFYSVREGLTTGDSFDVINKIIYDTESDSIKKLNTLRTVISMMNVQDTYTMNSILFDTTISDDAKIKRVKQMVDNIIATSSKSSGNEVVSGNAVVSGNTIDSGTTV
jgi:hypothetical protein